jgi:hypothetical protein
LGHAGAWRGLSAASRRNGGVGLNKFQRRKPSLSGESARELTTDRWRTGEGQIPQSEWRVQARLPDWEPIRGFLQGQRLD